MLEEDLVRENEKLRLEKESKCLIAHEEIDRLTKENVELRKTIFNLTSYLHRALDYLDRIYFHIVHDDNSFTNAFNIDFDGMPGYDPDILTAQHDKKEVSQNV